jgi:hypothetical protein
VTTLLDPTRRWWCPSCPLTDVTREAQPHSRMHDCPGMGGLSVPMVPEGVNATHVARERDDYVGTEDVRYDTNGRPVASVTTVRDDGEDVTVYAPTAHLRSDL